MCAAERPELHLFHRVFPKDRCAVLGLSGKVRARVRNAQLWKGRGAQGLVPPAGASGRWAGRDGALHNASVMQ